MNTEFRTAADKDAGGGRLSRAAGDAAAPVRIVHLGLGNFFRAHQAYYTDLAPDSENWGIAAFAGRSPHLADTLAAQDGLYTLITRGPSEDTARVVKSVVHVHLATDTQAWLKYFSDPEVTIVTLTVTEAGYLRDSAGGIDFDNLLVKRDLAALRAGPAGLLTTAPARLVAGLAIRRSAGAGPLALVSCDNLPDNGAVTAQVIGTLAAALDPELATWIRENISFVTSMVDRITPATTTKDAVVAAALTGRADAAPVVTEPFTEWVLAGEFPGGHPAWDAAGARFVQEITPFEERKLWLLNGAHSLLAYAGSARKHDTIAEAVIDPVCRAWMVQWWMEASAHLTFPEPELAAYREDLLDRFANPRLRHMLPQIVADGSQKLPIRILPVIRQEMSQGRLPHGGLRVLAAWVNHLRGAGAPVKDPAARALCALAQAPLSQAVPAVLGYLDSVLAQDDNVVATVLMLCTQMAGGTGTDAR